VTATRLKLYVALVVLVVAGLAYEARYGTQRDPRDVTFVASVKAGGRVTHVNWSVAPDAGSGSPSFTGHDWYHEVTLPHPGTWVLTLSAVVQPVKTLDGQGRTMFRGATTTCKIVTAGGAASNVGPSDPGKGCNITKVYVVHPDQ
jgi:hypothetical protein